MKVLLLFSLITALFADDTAAQTARKPASRGGVAITVTDPGRAVIPGVRVELTGPATNTGTTDANGQISFPGLGPGTYRLRFSGEAVTAFEREVTLAAGRIARLDITLNPAPAPPAPPAAPPPPPAPAAPPVGPSGEPQLLSLVDLVERELIGNNVPRKDTLVACSGNTRSMVVQLNDAQARRVYDDAETLYYVIAGEGVATVEGRDVQLQAGAFAALPRATPHSLVRKGRRPLILLAVLSGEPCEVAR